MEQYCPVTGLKVLSQPEWINQRVSDTFIVNFYIIGDSIIYSMPMGKADYIGVQNSLALNDEVAKHISNRKGTYVQIEDYTAMSGSTQRARKYFIDNVDANERRKSLIFCNLSSQFSIAVKIGKRFAIRLKDVYVAKHYNDAVNLALQLGEIKNFENSFWIQKICIDSRTEERSLNPINLLYDKNWDIDTPEFSLRSVIIDNCAIYSISKGFVEEKHIPLVERTQQMYQEVLPKGETIDYIVVDVSEQTGVARAVRRKYIRLLKNWYQQFPFQMYMLVGENKFMRSAALLPRPFMPFTIKFVQDCNQAMEIIRADQLGFSTKGKNRKINQTSEYSEQENIDRLLGYIATINWEKEGIENDYVVDENDPFYPVFQSMQLVKEELDSLFAERKQAEEDLLHSNTQLQITLTELQNTQEKIVQQERLAAVGQLVAGIAHDFNNILSSILIYAEILTLAPETPPEIQPKVKTIYDSGQRAAHLVRQLLDFSRKTVYETELVDFAITLKESLNFFKRTIPENIYITLDIGSDENYLIEADPTQLQQVITNLIVNARDAMPTGGILRLGLSKFDNRTNNDRCALCDQPIEGEWVQLKISDTGCGMNPEVRARIFEPFFTTKDIGVGTGLGLSQVAGIVGQHNGHIRVESEKKNGTTFTIYLPPGSPSVDDVAEPISDEIQIGKGETILLVEDEPTVLQATKEILENLNYRALTAINGQDALNVYHVHKAEIALILSDMIMPDVSGEKLFRILKKDDPEIKMIIMSGYPVGEQRAKLLELGVVTWLQKPTSINRLSQAIGKTLSDKIGRWD